jgi:naphthalene 1,2-dioxygenase system ferredoxin subunit
MAEIGETNWVRAASLDEIDPGEVVGLTIGERSIALYRLEGGVFATDNICTHAYALLSEGWLDGEAIECPLHGGCFNVKTGEALCDPVTEPLQTYPVRVENGEVFLNLPD